MTAKEALLCTAAGNAVVMQSKRMRKEPLKPIPQFRNEAEERKFWATHDTTDYLNSSQAKRAVFPRLHPSTESISLRLPAPPLADLKALANERDVPYQSLLKVLLAKL